MEEALNGRVALVTGAGRGIGRAIALALAARGMRVVLLARSQLQLNAVAAEISAAGGIAVAVAADVADPLQAGIAVRRGAAEMGEIGVLINNAAVVAPLGPTAGLDLAVVAAALRINVLGVIGLSGVFLAPMLTSGWGRIVNVSSGIVARPEMMAGATVYAATKAAVEAHTINLAAELAGTGVTANVYRPGSVDTATAASLVAGLSSESSGQVWNVADGEIAAQPFWEALSRGPHTVRPALMPHEERGLARSAGA
jgi:NAD(P)-dependent dehydrogenase (short-subunit alcohol dehydrogenase family)